MGKKAKDNIDSNTFDGGSITAKQLWFDPNEAILPSKQNRDPLPLPVDIATLLR